MNTTPTQKNINYVADFETITDPDDCRVWAYGIHGIENLDYFTYGNDLDDFMGYFEYNDNFNVYFHNLAFDGVFIIVWLFNHGFQWVADRKDSKTRTFTTLISDKGLYYSIKVYFTKDGKKTNTVTFFDSLKILPFDLDTVAKGFGLPRKLDLDYDKFREIGHRITAEELEYLRNDCFVIASALNTMFSQGLDKMTQGSNALHDYKTRLTPLLFKRYFPVPDYDEDVRRSYKGGFTYLKPEYSEIDFKEGLVLDVNSLYPSVMYYKPLPYGEGQFFTGKYEDDELYPLYVQRFECQFELKKNHIPSIQIKNNIRYFIPTQYLTSSGDEMVVLTLTSVDLKLFFEHYDVYNIEYFSGWKFKASTGMFRDYIDHWIQIKIQATIDENFAMRTLAKLMLNALYGKFALNPRVASKRPFLNDGVLKYVDLEPEIREPIYIPVGTFITSWARYTTITAAQTVYDRFIYADTDSLHLIGTEEPEGLEIDPVKLGAWKHESDFVRARYLRQKSYIETEVITDKAFKKMEPEEQKLCFYLDGIRVKEKITCAGMPKSCYNHVNWNNFHIGAVFDGKLTKKNVKGGIVLNSVDFTIKK
jgi:hypothetical protein